MPMYDDAKANESYVAVVNHEEQYSIWPDDKPIPLGWREAGKRGTKDQVLEFIEQVWTDMRPLSVRRHLGELERSKKSAE